MAERKPLAQDKVIPLEVATRPANVRIHLLGTLRATSYLGEDLVPRGRKARAILGYLCLHAGQRVPRARIAALLWDRVPDVQARASLRQALRELTLALGPLAEELILADAETLRLDPRSCWIDAIALLSGPQPAPLLRSDLAALCQGELLEDVSGITPGFDQWLLVERARFTTELTQILEEELQQIAGSDAPAERRAALARRVIGFDPTHEGACRVLMQALADLGERAQALREYERCRAAMKAALDAEPSAETRALHRALKTAPGAPRVEAAPAPMAAPRPAAEPLLPEAAPSARLRVGVLPFRDPAGQHADLALTLSQEIASALARFRWFDVIAPLSLQPPSPEKDEAFYRQKQWHYVVDGSLIAGTGTISISVRLFDIGQEARPVWSDHFELTADALDQLHERVVAPVVARIDPVILFIEGQRSASPRSGATSLALQAMPLIFTMERQRHEEAGRLIHQAIEADPQNSKAAAWAAHWHVCHVGQGWAEKPQIHLDKARELALQAIRNDPENAEALGIYAHICAFLEKDFDSAVHYFDKALKINPNIACIWAMSAPTYCYIGQPEAALRRLDRYMDLAPFDPNAPFWEGFYTIAYTIKGDYERAVTVGRRSVRLFPNYSNGYKPLIAALGHLGRREEAAPYVEKLLALEPHFTVARFGQTYPLQRAEDRERYMRGLELAGVPPG
jgi:DNA-binding SARP family transcriptional activator/TolB-like protein/Tfp pilus assembly protein PilF